MSDGDDDDVGDEEDQCPERATGSASEPRRAAQLNARRNAAVKFYRVRFPPVAPALRPLRNSAAETFTTLEWFCLGFG